MNDPWDDVIKRIAPDLEAAEVEFRAVAQRLEGLRFAMKYAQDAKADAVVRAAEADPIPRGPDSPARSPAEYPSGAGILSPSGLAEAILVKDGGEVKTQVIRERMIAATGHEFTLDQVKNALAYLRRKERVVHVGTALWRSSKSPVPPKSFTPADGTGVSTTGENGTSYRALTLSPERA